MGFIHHATAPDCTLLANAASDDDVLWPHLPKLIGPNWLMPSLNDPVRVQVNPPVRLLPQIRTSRALRCRQAAKNRPAGRSAGQATGRGWRWSLARTSMACYKYSIS